VRKLLLKTRVALASLSLAYRTYRELTERGYAYLPIEQGETLARVLRALGVRIFTASVPGEGWAFVEVCGLAQQPVCVVPPWDKCSQCPYFPLEEVE